MGPLLEIYRSLAHIQAGERSGNIDGVARHSLSKLAHCCIKLRCKKINQFRRGEIQSI